MLDGMMLFFDIALYTLGPDLGMDDEGMDAFNQRFNKNLDCHLHGELKDYDMRKAMWEEKGWEVNRMTTHVIIVVIVLVVLWIIGGCPA